MGSSHPFSLARSRVHGGGGRYPGCGGGLGHGGFDSLVLRVMDVLGWIRVCPTTHPEKCLDAFKGR